MTVPNPHTPPKTRRGTVGVGVEHPRHKCYFGVVPCLGARPSLRRDRPVKLYHESALDDDGALGDPARVHGTVPPAVSADG